MINLIAAANGKLDDPLMRQWAVQFYSDLPKHAHDQEFRLKLIGSMNFLLLN